eukprot:2615862-Rhodomonas_salina.3
MPRLPEGLPPGAEEVQVQGLHCVQGSTHVQAHQASTRTDQGVKEGEGEQLKSDLTDLGEEDDDLLPAFTSEELHMDYAQSI